MDTGKIDNETFYIGFEGEEEVMLSVIDKNMETLHIWEGYFSDIFCDPPLDGKGWHGFTRDYHQFEGAFDSNEEVIITDLQEYIDDLEFYKNRKFNFEETKEVYNLIYSWLQEVLKRGYKSITMKVW